MNNEQKNELFRLACKAWSKYLNALDLKFNAIADNDKHDAEKFKTEEERQQASFLSYNRIIELLELTDEFKQYQTNYHEA